MGVRRNDLASRLARMNVARRAISLCTGVVLGVLLSSVWNWFFG